MSRYNDIMRGPELNAAYVKYQQWLQLDRAAKQAAYAGVKAGTRLKIERIPAYLNPFGAPATLFLEVKGIPADVATAPAPAVRAALEAGTGRLTFTKPSGTNTVIRLPKAKLAKIIITDRVQTATTPSASRITGTQYLRHDTNSASSVFGQASATDDYDAAVTEMKGVAAVATAEAKIGGSVRFVPQGTNF